VRPVKTGSLSKLSSRPVRANNWDWLINYEWYAEDSEAKLYAFDYNKNTSNFRYKCYITTNVPNYMSDDMQAICDSFSVIENKK
jgi:hypothetical protein